MAQVKEAKVVVPQGWVGRSDGNWQMLTFIIAGLVLLLAFGFRVYRIDGQSLWYDEGVSAAMAPRALADITLRSAADIHPPLYYYLLHFWSQLAGSSEFALRWLSLMPSVLLVAVVFVLGRRLANRQVGIVAAIFAALSPLLIYYAQETRMYAQMAFLVSLSFLLFVHLIEVLTVRSSGGRRRLLWTLFAYVIATAAMLYSHYFAFTILVAQNLLALAYFIHRRHSANSHSALGDAEIPFGVRRMLAPWALTQVIVVGSYVPWLITTLPQLQSWPTISDPFGLPTLLRRVFLAFSFGLSSDAAATPNRELAFFIPLCCLALLPLARYRRKYYGAGLAVAFLMVPVLLIFLLSLQRPMYNPKFLLLAVPAYVLVLAFGLENLRQAGERCLNLLGAHLERRLARIWSVVVVVVLLGAIAYSSAQSLSAYYFDPKYARDDYRGLVGYIAANSSPGDAIVLNAPGQAEIFDYYYRGNQAVYPLPEKRPIEESNTEAALKGIVGRHPRVWLVLWASEQSDPNSFVEHWLDANSFKTANRWFGGIRLSAYATENDATANDQEVSVNFQNLLRLKAVHFDTPILEPGDAVNIALTWEASATINARYTVFVHVIDDEEMLWGQMDGEPAGGGRPTNTWASGMTILDRRGITVLPGTPPGSYRLELGVYRSESGQRLAIIGTDGKPAGDRFLFGPVQIALPKQPPAVASLALPAGPSASFSNGITLLGSQLRPLGRGDAGANFAPGDIAHLTLFWRSDAPASGNAAVLVAVRDQTGAVVLQKRRTISDGRFPTGQWQPGDIVRDQLKLPLDKLAQGDYSVTLTVLDARESAVAITAGNHSPLGNFIAIASMRVR